MEVSSGTVGNDNELARQRLSSSKGVSIPTFHRTHESQLVWRISVFASGGKMTGDAPYARTGLPLRHRVILDSVAHCWVPARTPTVHSAFTEGGRGWPQTRFTRHHQNDKTKVTAPRLGHEHGCGAGLLKPQIYEAATDKNTFTSPPQIQERPNRQPSPRF